MEPTGQKLNSQYKGRMIGLDFLRGVAMMLTLFRHYSFKSPNILWQIGWAGVHLFFVLSSFLITNILLTEYYKNGKINFGRFFIRRALKIYPLYYLFIITSVYKNRGLFLSSTHYKKQLLGQIFHLQNYTEVLWYHTWSLAAEEHFYLSICILLSVLLYLQKLQGLTILVCLCLFIVILTPYLRYYNTLNYQAEWFFSTHLIMDSFAFGALLAITKFVFPGLFSKIIELKHFLLLPIIIFLLPLFLLPIGNLIMNSIGMTFMFMGFTLLIAYFQSIENFSRSKNVTVLIFIKPLASIGIASYSIYLLHVPVKSIIYPLPISEQLKIPLYFIACILVGMVVWYLIEKPIATYKSNKFS